MNMTIQLAGLVLAAPADIVSGWAPALAMDVRPVRLFRARGLRQYGRGNAAVTYTFSVSRQHESYALAESYLDDLPRQVRNANEDAAGLFSKVTGLGGPAVALVLAKATFQAQPATGVRTTVAWTITGTLPASSL